MLLALWAFLSLLGAGLVTTMLSEVNAGVAFADASLIVGQRAVVANTDGDPIRIRKGAGTEFAQIAAAREGQIVSILAGPSTDERSIRWYKVQAPGGTGWMMAQFLQSTATAAPVPPSDTKLIGSARVANTDGDSLRVRSMPNAGGVVLTRLAPDTIVAIDAGPVTDETDIVWYRIKAGSLSGWAMARYLVQAQAVPETDQSNGTPDAQPATASQSSAGSSRAQYRQWMEEARVMYPYPQSVDKMWSVMLCESGGNANASGGGGLWLGLFQYVPATWRGSWNPYRANSIWDAKSQIFATAKAWSIGMQRHWSCY